MNRWMYLTLAHRGEKQKKGGQGEVGRVTVDVTWIRHGFTEFHFNHDLLRFLLYIVWFCILKSFSFFGAFFDIANILYSKLAWQICAKIDVEKVDTETEKEKYSSIVCSVQCSVYNFQHLCLYLYNIPRRKQEHTRYSFFFCLSFSSPLSTVRWIGTL